MMDGQQVGHYRIEAHLGDGADTQVFRAVDTVRRRPVALKLLRSELGTLALLQEAQLAEDLVHPHVAWVWETGLAGDQAYLAERLIHGQATRQLLRESGPLPWEQALEIIQQIAQAVDFASRKGWAHGDIRPENILYSLEQGAALTDFGLSRLRRKWQKSRQTDSAAKTPLGPAYAAPELWQGQEPTPASDQYALACTLVELLTGQALFSGAEPRELREQHLTGSLLPADGWGMAPRAALGSLQRALALNPDERFASAEEFAETVSRQFAQGARVDAAGWRAAAEERRRRAEEVERQRRLEEARREVLALAAAEGEALLAGSAPPALAEAAAAPVTPEETAGKTPAGSQPTDETSPLNQSPAGVSMGQASEPEEAALKEIVRPQEMPGRRKRAAMTLPRLGRGQWIILGILAVIVLALVISGTWLVMRGGGAPGPRETPTRLQTEISLAEPLAAALTDTPTATPSPTAASSPTSTPTVTATATSVATATPSATGTSLPTSSPSPSPTIIGTFTPEPPEPDDLLRFRRRPTPTQVLLLRY